MYGFSMLYDIIYQENQEHNNMLRGYVQIPCKLPAGFLAAYNVFRSLWSDSLVICEKCSEEKKL